MQYRVGLTTVANIVPEVCKAIWDKMFPVYMPMPDTPEQWLAISRKFFQRWNFPNCVGALDGKHIVLRAPFQSGSLYYNYKGTFSIVLMALADADSRFIYIDVGEYGKHSDGGIFSHSEFGDALLPPNTLELPEDRCIEEAEELGPLPFVVVGDEAFPCKNTSCVPTQAETPTQPKMLSIIGNQGLAAL